MNKFFKKVISLGVVTTMVVSSVIPAFASSNASLQINGQDSKGVSLTNETGTTMISAKDAKELFGETITGDAISIREIATDIGYNVGWDHENRTVILIDEDQLLKDIGEFETFDKLLAYEKSLLEGQVVSNSEMDIKFNVTNPETAEALTIDAKATTESIVNNMKQSSKINIVFDFSNLPQESITEEDKAMFEQIKNISIELIADMETGKIYFTSKELLKIAEMPENTWVLYDIKAIFAEIFPNEDVEAMYNSILGSVEGTNYKDMVSAQLNMMLFDELLTSVDDYTVLVDSLSIFNDESFKKEGNNLVSKYEENVEDLINVLVSIIINQDADNNINGYSMEMLMGIEDMDVMNFKVGLDADNKGTIALKYGVPGIVMITANGTYNYADTDKLPSVLPADANVISLIDM